MHQLERNYVAMFNGRTGALWEGRYKSCLVDNADYVLRCNRYIELNTIRARLTDDPIAYRWFSCAVNLGKRAGSALTLHPCWLALGKDATGRSSAYRALLDEVVTNELLANIRIHIQQQRALGHDAFCAMVEARTDHFADVKPAHRPCRPTTTTE